MCSSARVVVGEGAVACRSTSRRRGDVCVGVGEFAVACRSTVHSPASWRCAPRRASAWARGAGALGEVLFGASWRGREARQGLQRGDVRRSLRRAAAGEGAEAHDLQPGEVFGACRRGHEARGREVCSPAPWRCVHRRVSAWGKARWPAGPQPGVVAMRSSARWPAGPQPGVVAMCSSARFGVGEGAVACSSINFGRPGALLGSSVAFGSGYG